MARTAHGAVVRSGDGPALHLPVEVAKRATSGGTYLQSPRATPTTRERERQSAAARLRKQGLSGAALAKRLGEMGYNTSGFGG